MSSYPIDITPLKINLIEKLILGGGIKALNLFQATEYPLVLQGVKPDVGGKEHYHQFVMRETGGNFGEQINGKWVPLWEVATKDYVDDNLMTATGQSEIKTITSAGSCEFDVPVTIPNGYRFVTILDAFVGSNSFAPCNRYVINTANNIVTVKVTAWKMSQNEMSPFAVAVILVKRI